MHVKNIDGVALIGFRLNPDREAPEAYTLMTYGTDEIVLCVNGEIILFGSRSQVELAFSLFDEPIREMAKPPHEIALVCDLASALHLMTHEENDESAVVLNCLNTILDLLYAAQIDLPVAKKKTLNALADHLTFKSSLSEFMDSGLTNRTEIVDLVIWCVGAILMRSRFLKNDSH